MINPQTVLSVIGATALLAVGAWLGRCSVGEPKPEVDTLTVERQITKRDTVTETRPVQVVQYDTVETLDTVTVAVPMDLDMRGIIAPNPVDITGQDVTLTYYNPNTRRWTQNEYRVGLPNNRLSGYGTTQLLAGLPVAHMGAEYAHTWRDFWIFSSATAEWHGGYGITPEGPGEVFGATVTADIKW